MLEHCGVERINVVTNPVSGQRRATGVTLVSGQTVEAEHVVLCAGQWSKQVRFVAQVETELVVFLVRGAGANTHRQASMTWLRQSS